MNSSMNNDVTVLDWKPSKLPQITLKVKDILKKVNIRLVRIDYQSRPPHTHTRRSQAVSFKTNKMTIRPTAV